jgi:hypothetical protein
MVVLPIDQRFSKFSFSCELDGVSYSFTFYFNDRDGLWYFDLGDANGTTLVAGLAAVTGMPLLSCVRYLAGTPPGELIVIDTSAPSTGVATDPTFDSLGRQHKMYYASPAELP